jgi:hypothetical protein
MTKTITEAEIMEKVVDPKGGRFPPDVARVLLSLKFDGSTTRTIRKLLRQNNRGTITAKDRLDLEKYLRVGQMLDLLRAKARISLREIGKAP